MVLAARIIILVALVAMAHYVVVSKRKASPEESTQGLVDVGATPKMAYAYSEDDYLTSKLVVIIGLVLLV